MASVTYTKMWLTNVVTEQQISGFTDRDRKRTYAVKGEVRTYAGGRQRAVGSFGTSQTWAFSLVQMLAADVATLAEWMDSGVTVFARDHLGQSMYGTFFDMETTEGPGLFVNPPTCTLSLTLQLVDVVEGV